MKLSRAAFGTWEVSCASRITFVFQNETGAVMQGIGWLQGERLELGDA